MIIKTLIYKTARLARPIARTIMPSVTPGRDYK